MPYRAWSTCFLTDIPWEKRGSMIARDFFEIFLNVVIFGKNSPWPIQISFDCEGGGKDGSSHSGSVKAREAGNGWKCMLFHPNLWSADQTKILFSWHFMTTKCHKVSGKHFCSANGPSILVKQVVFLASHFFRHCRRRRSPNFELLFGERFYEEELWFRVMNFVSSNHCVILSWLEWFCE